MFLLGMSLLDVLVAISTRSARSTRSIIRSLVPLAAYYSFLLVIVRKAIRYRISFIYSTLLSLPLNKRMLLTKTRILIIKGDILKRRSY